MNGPSPVDRALAERIRAVARFMLPFDAVVAVASPERSAIELEGRTILRFPAAAPNDRGESRDWTDLVAQVEALRGTAGFLLFPASALPWLERQPELRRYLMRQCRLALDKDGTCTVYAIDPHVGEQYEAPDGLPIPPPELACLVSGISDPKYFYESGAVAHDYMTAIVSRAGKQLGEVKAILDFGCGCGRVIRHWRESNGTRLSGSDYNPYLIQWCRDHLPGADFKVNRLGPPLDYEDESFDFVYSISAFTHFNADLQLEWMNELRRVTRPGGLILITVHGMSRIESLSPEAREHFLAGELVVWRPEQSGSNLCAAYHPERYVRETLGRGLSVRLYLAGAAVDAKQDVVLLQKPASKGSVSKS